MHKSSRLWPARHLRPISLLALLLLLAVLALVPRPSQATPQAADVAAGTLSLLRSDESGVTFELFPPELIRTPLEIESGRYEALSMPGYGQMREPGRPDLPQTSLLIALPPGAEPVLDLLGQETSELNGVRAAPAAAQELANPPAGSLAAYTPEFVATQAPDPAIYASNAPFPAVAPVELGNIFWLRDQRVVQLHVRPVQARPAQETLTLYERLEVSIDFHYPDGPREPSRTRPESEAYETLLQANLLNYDAGRQWREPQPISLQAGPSPCLDDNAFRITLEEAGMYRLSYAELAAAGLTGTPSSASIRMCNENQEIRIRVLDGGDGNFSSGDFIQFYGEQRWTHETHTNVYWFTYGGPAGLRIAGSTPSGSTSAPDYWETLHREEDTYHKGDTPMTDENDHWYWQAITIDPNGSNPVSFEETFSVSNKASATHDVTIQIEFYGQKLASGGSTTYRFEVFLNGLSLGIDEFTGTNNTRYLYEDTISSTQLQNGSNTLRVTPLNVNGNGYAFQANWFEVTFRRQFVAQNNRLLFTQDTAGNWQYSVSGFSGTADVYNVTDPKNPVRITNAGGSGTINFGENVGAPAAYALASASGYRTVLSVTRDTPSNLHGANTADYIIITDPLFDSTLTPLRQRRQTQGLVVKTVFVRDIFDEFSYGIYSTQAIADFLAYAYANWDGGGANPAPAYVLLVGEGSYDHRNVLGNNGANDNLVPVHLVSGIDSNIGEAAADNRYVAWGQDNLAQMQLGRIPVETTAELTTVIDKIISYENEPFNLLRHTSHFFVTDNAHNGPRTGNPPYCTLDPAGDFFRTVDEFINTSVTPFGQTAHRLYYAPLTCYPDPDASPRYDTFLDHYAGGTVDAQNRVLNQFNSGHHFIVYTGHSGTLQWGKANENFMGVATIPQVSNAGELSIMLPMTCLEGIYHFPEPEFAGVSERLLRHAGGGAVASYAPTGLQVRTAHDVLVTGFYNGLLQNGGNVRMGNAVMQAKINLLQNGQAFFQDLHDTYMLLGDPGMPVKHWQGQQQLNLPVTMKP